MQSTEWMPIAGYEGFYEVSSNGDVRSTRITDALGRPRRPRLMKPGTKAKGYRYVGLRDYLGVTKYHHVHRLVLTAFSCAAPEDRQACHSDGNPSNNSIQNLRWGTALENHADIRKHGTHHETQKTACPQGHMLDAPNLVASHAAKGWRKCLACNRERSISRKQGRPFDADRANAKYAGIVA